MNPHKALVAVLLSPLFLGTAGCSKSTAHENEVPDAAAVENDSAVPTVPAEGIQERSPAIVSTPGRATDTAAQSAADEAKVAEQRAAECFRRLTDILENRPRPAIHDSPATETDGIANDIAFLQSTFEDLQTIAKLAPKSAVIQELLGEAAYQFASGKSAVADRSKEGRGESTTKTTPGWKLKDIAVESFEYALELDADRSLPYDRLARLRLDRKKNYADPLVAEYLSKSIRTDPADPVSISLLCDVLCRSDILSDAAKRQEIYDVLKNVNGRARDELQHSLARIQAELAQAELGQAGKVPEQDVAVRTSARTDALDLKIAHLEGIRMQYEPEPRGFRGFLGELNRQAEDAGNFAARQAIDNDIDELIRQRELILAGETKRRATRSNSKTKSITRLEKAEAFLLTLIDGKLGPEDRAAKSPEETDNLQRPVLGRRQIDNVKSGKVDFAGVTSLMLDYDLAAVSRTDYEYLVDLIKGVKESEDEQLNAQMLRNAYNAAAGGGAEVPVEGLLADDLFSRSSFRLSMLKTFIDSAKSGDTPQSP